MWQRIWYTRQGWHYPLIPLSWLYRAIVCWRRQRAQRQQPPIQVPIIVVGNLTVGGTGKTPLVIKLAHWLTTQHLTVGIVSRGYGGKAPYYPYPVTPASDPAWVGDEPVLIAQRTGLPVVVAPQRNRAVQYLLERHACEVMISDDGLQHYAMPRTFEIAVIDGQRGVGNGHCLPAGPLREPIKRLTQVDLVVINTTQVDALEGGDAQSWTNKVIALGQRQWADLKTPCLPMWLEPGRFINLRQPDLTLTPAMLQGKTVHAVAAIGHPARFFQTLRDMQLTPHCHAFADHYMWRPADLAFGDHSIVLMTEKDAVKCRQWATPNMWYLPVDAQLSKPDVDCLLHQLRQKLAPWVGE